VDGALGPSGHETAGSRISGKANRALCRLIARRAGVAPSRVTIVRGEHAREKLVRVDGLPPTGLPPALTE
jgi:uncharacterized protein YggU (UPF0235/DUF167 family)